MRIYKQLIIIKSDEPQLFWQTLNDQTDDEDGMPEGTADLRKNYPKTNARGIVILIPMRNFTSIALRG